MNHYNIVIIGGGLAGLTAALDLSKKKYRVLLIEKHIYPHHKVCGEYVSNEILPYLNTLGISLEKVGAVSITNFQLSTKKGTCTSTKLPLGGKGISRYAFDNLLFKHAKKQGAKFLFDTVNTINYENNLFTVSTASNQQYTAEITIGAYGKRAHLDKQLNRDFFKEKSSWLGVKAHYQIDHFPDNLVALHNFDGGYGGLSKTETGAVNFCYLTTYNSFKPYNTIEAFHKNVVSENPFLKEFLEKATPLFEKPLTIAQISFHKKKPVENHILMCGDTAGLIHPLCGNGMAMAIHSAKIASDLIHEYFIGNLKNRSDLEKAYHRLWNSTFKRRLWMGRRLQALLLSPTLSKHSMTLASKAPKLLQKLIKLTHGKPIV
ncbi:NAD(P)/FAD-dependent oxidoreductase [Ascidiimonas sp. W6]|uniref:NAD(P)/FAD-dependent oxidoreductase n=1 Tax=Ascidiimonas meishanensis TaxID=3128903 RepID=UPI0030EDEE91